MATKPKELMRLLKADGWEVVRVRGSHHIMKHASKVGMITIPMHNAELPIGTCNVIMKQAGLK